ncbi:hypothetical protein HYDPIDRAFT_176829 [Hydnomerulius pinastri MD-312]|uniref:Domain of unknown function at the cortex 1 domain-containing protein n=1 Tax=Hydnomerulius pinastri MD-312 TaxID=994086 RepID=A0A0C9VUV2_9AGAM|nr:hypothetical protein HYDPIDRAFT_176829 [Hydnomerulius pinastri MD-312]
MPRLRVLAGPTAETLVPITDIVNSGRAHVISSDRFEGKVAVNVKSFVNPQGKRLTSEYFEREDRKGITWSIQVQGRFLEPHSADDILFGNTFDKVLKLPWGSSAALKFMQYIDPTLEHDLTSTSKPWALSPLIATMPHFAHERLHNLQGTLISEEHESAVLQSPFPPTTSISDDTSQLRLASKASSSGFRSGSQTPSSSSSSSLSASGSLSSDVSASSVKSSLRETVKNSLKKPLGKAESKRKRDESVLIFRTPGERRSYFSNAQHRKDVVLGPEDLISMDFCYGYLEFSPTLALRLPGGLSFDLVRYWDKHPVRFVCCERKRPSIWKEDTEQPVGKLFWCVAFEMADDDEDEEPGEPASGQSDANDQDNTRDID